MGPTRIILDTDLAMGAGSDIDDGFALALAHADPDIQLDMITTVHGNTDVESATILTGVLMKRLGIEDTPLYKGAATPMIHPDKVREPSPHVEAMRHDGSRIAPSTGYAPVTIVEHVMRHPGEITLVAIGPLTNIAIAILLEPRMVTAVKELVIMGGYFMEAARTVLKSGIKQRWVGLDVTLQCHLSIQDAEQLASSRSSFAQFAGQATIKWINYLAETYPGRSKSTSCAMHDPLAVAVVSHPEICTFNEMYVDIVTGTGLARGVMVSDRLKSRDPPKANCSVAVEVDAEGFRKHFMGLIDRL
ncbi:Inosine/uridine-preferring nucleoside hydrolase domain-containing protein [Kockovaella imperatae]|uniref:Inosine/uridine-preferring nucleoside hydrolase domain-containing protein n=1 Tax=Kockovaella imperatae TaxID=4999 RepID=A0A1Y1UM62_9TREE|nr:Inosine/uridine-preferring nucleoside hydrolase domain-containing protein [Kockovaella imperatae]ORX39082.1 Inosine/uridine-preferring nucleoside hydrolase domain-containing protein [Kockovaella imperatae]